MISSSIAIGFYTFLVVQNQVVTIEHPSLATYQQLYQGQNSTLQCPCSRLSIPYSTFLNITYVLHQVCSSDFVSPIWLDYVSSFDPTLVPPWTETDHSRDFRTIGGSYFQFLATVCSITKTNLDDAHRVFMDTQLVTDRVLAPPLFNQRTEAMIESFITTTGNDFARTVDWINFVITTSFFLIGTNVNAQITVDDTSRVNVETPLFSLYTEFDEGHTSSRGVCSCVSDGFLCSIVPLVYINASSVWDFQQVFGELPIACLPSAGFLLSKIAWWYNDSYLENIRDTYSILIGTEPLPVIMSLNASVPSRFNETDISELLHEMLMERWIDNASHFDVFYEACAPISCSYTVIRRRDIIVILLLFISICGGLNSGLRILIPFGGTLVSSCVERWKNRNNSEEGK